MDPNAPANDSPAESTQAGNVPAPSNVPASGGTPAENSPSGGNPNPANSTTGPNDVTLTERFLSNSSWPADLVLDLGKSNWLEWSFRLENLTDNQGFSKWLDGSLPCPDKFKFPKANRIWMLNDRSLRAFILARISKIELLFILHIRVSYDLYQELKKRHEHLGLYAQVLLIKKALDVRFDHSTPFSNTISHLHELHTQIMNMGPMDPDNLFAVFLINVLGNGFSQLQSSIQSLTDTLTFTSATIVKRLQAEETLSCHRTDQGYSPPPDTALAALARGKKGNLLCAHCKRTNHLTDYCIHPGGKMAGKSLEEARLLQNAALRRSMDSRLLQPSPRPSVSPAMTTET
jgi:hypothetical protein